MVNERVSSPGLARLLSAALGALALAAWPAGAVVVPDQYGTIQQAIDVARAGVLGPNAVIDVRPGVHRGPFVIDSNPIGQSITIRATDGAGSTVLDGGGAGTTLTIRGPANGTTGPIRIERVTITGGRGTGFAGGGFAITDSSPSFVGVRFFANQADFGGGGTLARSNASFVDCNFESNQAKGPGGGIVTTMRSAPTFTRGLFSLNASGAASVAGRTDSGGAVHSNDSSPSFFGTRFSRNQSKFDGGAIHHQGPNPEALPPGAALSILTLEDVEIDGNVTVPSPVFGLPSEGGGILAEDYALVILKNSHVHGNVSNHGGGLRSHRASYQISGSRIEGNVSKDPTGRGGVGGGVSIGGYAPPYDAFAVIRDTAIVGNEADVGGGIAIDGGACPGSCKRPSLVLLESLVADNVSLGRGGGIFAARSTVRIDTSQILRNRVAGGPNPSGGGIFVVSGSVVDDGAGNGITNTTIADNFADLAGGGVFADLNTTIRISGSRVYHNRVTTTLSASSGGGVTIGAAGPVTGSIVGSTIADNTNPQIFEISSAGSQVEFRNNPSLQSAPGGPTQIYARNGTPPQSSILLFELLLVGRASGNAANAPAFTHLDATPNHTESWVAYTAARAGSAALGGMAGPFAVPTDLELYTNPCQALVQLSGSGVIPASVTVAGAGCNPDHVRIVTGPATARAPEVRVFAVDPADPAHPTLYANFFAYDPAFRGGVTVAGLREPLRVVTGTGPGGGPTVQIFDVETPNAVRWLGGFNAYDPAFTAGIVVATGEIDGKPVVITAPQRGGGPQVRVFDVTNAAAPRSLGGFNAFDPSFTGGVTLAAADLDGEPGDEIVVGAGPGGGPQVVVFKWRPDGFRFLTAFFAYDPRFSGGVFVGAGDVDGDGKADVITGAGPGGGPDVAVYRNVTSGAPTRVSFFPYDPRFNGGVRVSAMDVNEDGRLEVVTVPGTGGGPNITTYRLDGASFAVVNSFFGYEANFTGGLWGAGLP